LAAMGKKPPSRMAADRRNPNIPDRRSSSSQALYSPEFDPETPPATANSQPIKLVELDGNIGILCNGIGLTMATLDAVTHAKGKPANFVNLGSLDRDFATSALRERAELGLELVAQDKGVKVILVNILGCAEADGEMTAAVAGYLERKARANRQIQVVLRLFGGDRDAVLERLDKLPVQLAETLDEAVSQAVSLAK
jgi:succinyl-CoA synthetase beta subunit